MGAWQTARHSSNPLAVLLEANGRRGRLSDTHHILRQARNLAGYWDEKAVLKIEIRVVRYRRSLTTPAFGCRRWKQPNQSIINLFHYQICYYEYSCIIKVLQVHLWFEGVAIRFWSWLFQNRDTDLVFSAWLNDRRKCHTHSPRYILRAL